MIPAAEDLEYIARRMREIAAERSWLEPTTDDGSRADEPDTDTMAFEIEITDFTALGGG